MKVVILWLINEHDEVLLSRRALHISSDAGMWGPSVSGKIDAGETPEQAAVRELHEELGVKHGDAVHFLHNSAHDHPDGRLRELTLFYTRVRADAVNSMQLEPTEVAAVKWVAIDHLQDTHARSPETILAGTNKPLWHEIITNLRHAVKA